MTYEASRRQKEPIPAKYFIAVMVGARGTPCEFEAALEAELGPIEARSSPYEFSRWSPYYDSEMGAPVRKRFLVFRELRPMENLVRTKNFAERLQARLALTEGTESFRRVNLDPGYLTPWNIVLSTVKSFAHRLYLGGGIFGEVTLLFRNGRYEPLPWTYPDYASEPVLTFFGDVRSAYMRQLSVGEPRLETEGLPKGSAD